ncbi:DUF4920 domain-containing protein [Bacteroidetes bacterium SCGC AAA795-G10]|nr:DUF4920 domain-containing protein [Bacteroidetes bacterium SCGC AAA795-G10]
MIKIKVLQALFIISASLSGQETSYGENIEEGSVIENSQIQNLFAAKRKFNAKLEAKVTDVCQMKGCWMKLDIGNEKEIMVNFKDYSFFVPKNIIGKKVVVSGEAFKRNISVDELKHYARDRGEKELAISLIVEPKEIYSLTAKGVVLLQ